jgi:hypothetical protein
MEAKMDAFVVAWGFRDCDVCGAVAIPARSPDEALRRFDQVLVEWAEEYAAHGEETPEEVLDELWYVGPYHESLEDISSNFHADPVELKASLDAGDVFHLDVG